MNYPMGMTLQEYDYIYGVHDEECCDNCSYKLGCIKNVITKEDWCDEYEPE